MINTFLYHFYHILYIKSISPTGNRTKNVIKEKYNIRSQVLCKEMQQATHIIEAKKLIERRLIAYQISQRKKILLTWEVACNASSRAI